MTNPPPPLILPTRDVIAGMDPFIGLDLEHILLVATQHEAQKALDDLLHHTAIGFDTESRPTFRKGQKSEGPHVLQFATQHKAYVFQTYLALCRPAIAKIRDPFGSVRPNFFPATPLVTIRSRSNERSMI